MAQAEGCKPPHCQSTTSRLPSGSLKPTFVVRLNGKNGHFPND